MRALALTSLLALIVTASGCGSDSPAGPPGAGDAPMSARIDGSQWNAAMALGVRSGNLIGVSGADAGGTAVALAWIDEGATTYTVGSSVGANGTVTSGGSAWTANAHVGSGSIVVTSLSATRITGTFSFALEPVPGTAASGARSITQGTFDVPLQQ